MVTELGDVTHTFTDDDDHTIIMTVTDEDGSYDFSKNVSVNNVAPVLVLAGAVSVAEGSEYTLTLDSLTDSGEDTISSYSIDWGDGTDATVVTGLGDVTHTFADGNTDHTIIVTATDEDGSYDFSKAISVNNVAPEIALEGDSESDVGEVFTLTLGDVVDPGHDTITEYIIDWGDGSVLETSDHTGDLNHSYAVAGDYTILVDLIDEDGTHDDAGSHNITINAEETTEIIHLGDAPARLSRRNPDAWEDAWTDDAVQISHKADYTDSSESWTSASLHGRGSHLLSGGDIATGDLGVSGQSINSSSVRQEIDGSEALKFDLDEHATKVTVDLARLDADSTSEFYDAGRIQLLDDSGNVVDEFVFSSEDGEHEQQVSLEYASGFSSVVLTAGVYHGSEFIFGGLADENGAYQSNPVEHSGTFDGSDFVLDAIEFEFSSIVTTEPPVEISHPVSILSDTALLSDSRFSFDDDGILMTISEDVSLVGIQNDSSDFV